MPWFSILPYLSWLKNGNGQTKIQYSRDDFYSDQQPEAIKPTRCVAWAWLSRHDQGFFWCLRGPLRWSSDGLDFWKDDGVGKKDGGGGSIGCQCSVWGLDNGWCHNRVQGCCSVWWGWYNCWLGHGILTRCEDGWRGSDSAGGCDIESLPRVGWRKRVGCVGGEDRFREGLDRLLPGWLWRRMKLDKRRRHLRLGGRDEGVARLGADQGMLGVEIRLGLLWQGGQGLGLWGGWGVLDLQRGDSAIFTRCDRSERRHEGVIWHTCLWHDEKRRCYISRWGQGVGNNGTG